jgi:hypothetical protein
LVYTAPGIRVVDYRALAGLAVLAVLTVLTVHNLYDFVAGTVAEWGTLDLWGRLIHSLLIAVGLAAVAFCLVAAWAISEDIDPDALVCGVLRLLPGTARGCGSDAVNDAVNEVASLDRELMETLIGSKGCRHSITVTVPVRRPLRRFYITCLCYHIEPGLLDSVAFYVSSGGTSVDMIISDRWFGEIEVRRVNSVLDLAVNLGPEELAEVSDFLRGVGCDPLSDLELDSYRELHRVVSGMGCRGYEVVCHPSCPVARRSVRLLEVLREVAARVALAS